MPAFTYKKEGRVALLTLNRPEVHNAIDSEMWDGLQRAWIDVRDDPHVWVAILTGAGDKAFSAGQDLKEMAEWLVTPENKRGPYPIPEVNPMRSLQVWKPFIAAINGLCVGGGLELAMACDIRIASDNALLGLAEVKRGVFAGNSGILKLPRLVPFAKALEMLMTGELIDAQEAYRIGLVNKVVPLADLMAEVEALAHRICENAPLAVRATKELAYRGIEMSLTDALPLQSEIGEPLAKSEDAREGARAFAEKRKPIFKGR